MLKLLNCWDEILGMGMEFDQEFPEAVNIVTVADAIEVAQEFFQDVYVSMLGPANELNSLLPADSLTR